MKVTYKGFDPEIGKEYAENSTGSVIAPAKSSNRESMPQGLDAQEQQDWLLSQRRRAPASAETEQDGVKAESLRRSKARRLLPAQPGRTPGSSK